MHIETIHLDQIRHSIPTGDKQGQAMQNPPEGIPTFAPHTADQSMQVIIHQLIAVD
jgi:hypothetical protein